MFLKFDDWLVVRERKINILPYPILILQEGSLKYTYSP